MLSISTMSEHSQSCNRMDQAGRTHFVGHCRHLHTNTHTYLTLCACKPAWGRVRNCFPSASMAHAPVPHAMALGPCNPSRRSWLCPCKRMWAHTRRSIPVHSCCMVLSVSVHTLLCACVRWEASAWKRDGFDYSQRVSPLPFLFLLCSHSCWITVTITGLCLPVWDTVLC